MLLDKPKTFKANSKFKAQCYILTEAEGGRKKGFFSN